MSTIAKTGGVNIDGIFIDEGFGSLDNDSIDDALDILGSIQRAHGMVGIISHVEVLRSNIPTKIQVVKRRESSTIE
jgi:DNA repair exonuclease SbcCD ATPase subunit